MSERKEDAALEEIIKIRKVKKWKDIARVMEEQFGITGRSGKQCRERWHNQLNPGIKKQTWTEEQEKVLFRCHDTHGNKWAKIAKQLPGRTDNCIKNHFYSTLRKAVRRLNRFISECRDRGDMKQIKPIVLSKIIVVSGERWDKRIPSADDLVKKCMSIKERLIRVSKDADQPTNSEDHEFRKLVMDIMEFNKLYKRKKNRRRKRSEDEQPSGEVEQQEAQQSVKEEPDDELDKQTPQQQPQPIGMSQLKVPVAMPFVAPTNFTRLPEHTSSKESLPEMMLMTPSQIFSGKDKRISQNSMWTLEKARSIPFEDEHSMNSSQKHALMGSSGMDNYFMNGLPPYRRPSEPNMFEVPTEDVSTKRNDVGNQLSNLQSSTGFFSSVNPRTVSNLFELPKDPQKS